MPRALPWLAGAELDSAPVKSSTKNATCPQPKKASSSRAISDPTVGNVSLETRTEWSRSVPCNMYADPGREANIDILNSIPLESLGCDTRKVSESQSCLEHLAYMDSFMLDGLEKDDKYRMVEDEFLDAAKLFTQHLHAAEYRRLKKVVMSQNAASIHSISRPVTASLRDDTKNQAAKKLKSRRHANVGKALRGLSDDDSEDHDQAWRGTALDGLLSPRKSRSLLTEAVRAGGVSRIPAARVNRPDRHRSTALRRAGSTRNEGYLSRDLSGARAMPRYNPRQPSLRLKYENNGVSDGVDVDDDDDLDAPVKIQGMLDEPASKAELSDNAVPFHRDMILSRRRMRKKHRVDVKDEHEDQKKLPLIPTFFG